MNIVLMILSVLLMVLGVLELFQMLVHWLLRSPKGGKMALMIMPDSGEDCEYLLRLAWERLSSMELQEDCGLVCINREEDPEINKICRLFSLRHPQLRVCKGEEMVYNVFEQEFEKPERG